MAANVGADQKPKQKHGFREKYNNQ